MPRAKVLLLGKLPPPYMGPSVATQLLLQSDLKNRFELIHFDTKLNDDLNDLGKWKFSKLTSSLTKAKDLRKRIQVEQPDLTIIPIAQTTMGFMKDIPYIWAATRGKGRTVVQLRGSDFKRWVQNAPNWMKWLVKKSLNRCTSAIVLSPRLKHLFEDFFTDDRIFALPNGGNYKIPIKGIERDLPLKLLYLANLQATKGIEDVIEAMKICKEKGIQSIALDVVGQWRDKVTQQSCEDLVRTHQLPVTFHPPKTGDEKLQVLSRADAFIFTPRAPEGHPWVTVEAMAAGLPIIATDQGAICDFVREGENGFIVPTQSPESIALAIEKWVQSSEQIQQMGNRSRAIYLEELTEEVLVENYAKAIEAILSLPRTQ